MTFRIGQGFDVHAFTDGDHVMLGGVRVDHDRGVDAHSDGDVVLHALCDAMRSALAAALGADVGAVSVKATTTERLGYTGRGEGIAAHAVCLLRTLQA